LDENIVIDSISVCLISLGSLGESSIDDWDVVHVVIVKSINEIWEILEVDWVMNKILVVVHPVDV